MSNQPVFSVIMATRNRPALFLRALNSVLAQTFDAFEIIVVLDGSNPDHRAGYGKISTRNTKVTSVIELPHREDGHGQSYALNTGVMAASGDYVAFLDDDDIWSDSTHLAAAADILMRDDHIDLYTTAQHAYRDMMLAEDALWLNTVPNFVTPDPESGLYFPTLQQLMQVPGFCQLNTLMVRRSLYLDIGGMDESIGWECDRDLNLRLWDVAGKICFRNHITAHHFIPDPDEKTSITTALTTIDRLLQQKRVLDKLASGDYSDAIAGHAREHSIYNLKKLALACYSAGRTAAARHFAVQATHGISLKWRLVSLAMRLGLWPKS